METPRPRKKSDPDPHPLIIDLVTAGRKLGVGKTKTYELVSAGVLETFLIGNRRKTTPEFLEAARDRLVGRR